LIHRGTTDKSRNYDLSYEKIIKRLQEHQQKTVPVFDKYAKIHGSTKIDGTGSFEEVYNRIAIEIDLLLSNRMANQ